MKLIHKGKVKDVYEVDDTTYLFHFSDRISAFDVQMPTMIPRKGEVLCQFAKFWFESLDVDNHMIGVRDKDKMVVKKLNMIPLEFIVRGYFYGSIVERYAGFSELNNFRPILASRLPGLLFDPTTKSDKHDVPINEECIVENGLLSRRDLLTIKKISFSIYSQMSTIVGRAGFIISDAKFEFGFDHDGKLILLADSLGPDEFRLWQKSAYTPGRGQQSYDKQILRDWLIGEGFRERFHEQSRNGLEPLAPNIPTPIVKQLSHRYIYAYEQICRKKL